MKPSIIRILSCLPKTVSGKIDRNALEVIEISNSELIHTGMDNLTDVQRNLCYIWESVLHRKLDDIESSFLKMVDIH